jgi:hypothetical protein
MALYDDLELYAPLKTDAKVYDAIGGSELETLSEANSSISFTTDGDLGDCADFDGSVYLYAASVKGPTGDGARTISCWIKTSSGSYHGLISWGEGGGAGEWCEFMLSSGGGGALAFEPGYEVHSTGSIGANDGDMHHCVMTVGAGETAGDVKIYLDGVEQFPYGGSATINTGTSPPLKIGAKSAGSAQYYGLMADVKIWSRQLSGTEVGDLFTAGVNPAGGGGGDPSRALGPLFTKTDRSAALWPAEAMD